MDINLKMIADAKAGNEEALTELYRGSYNQAYNTVRFLVKDEDAAQDILQDSYIKAFASLNQLEEAGSFLPWLKQIARNKALDHLKKRRDLSFTDLTAEDADGEIEFEDEDRSVRPELVLDQAETTRLLNHILDTLPPEQRAVISLYYYDGLSVKEIAGALGIPEATVKSRLQYGRKKIKAEVEELERKGTRLHGLAPLPFFLELCRHHQELTMDLPVPAVPGKVLSGVKAAAAGAAEATGGNTAAGAAQATVQTAAKTAASGAARSFLSGKVIAVALAALVVIGGGGLALSRLAGKTAEPVEQATELQPPADQPPAPPVQPPSPPVPPEEAPQPGEEPAETGTPDESIYDTILAGYTEALTQDREAFLNDYDSGKYDHADSDLNYAMINEHFRGGYPVHYAIYDFNGDGVNELAIALKEGDYIEVMDVYTLPADGAAKLFTGDLSLAYRVNAYLLEDGTFLVHSSGSAYSGTDTICRIAGDRGGMDILAVYEYDAMANGDLDHISAEETLTDEEFSERYWSKVKTLDQAEGIVFREFVPGLTEAETGDGLAGEVPGSEPEAGDEPKTEGEPAPEAGALADEAEAGDVPAAVDAEYRYYQLEELFLAIPRSWDGKYLIERRADGLTVYHKASYEKWQEKGSDGGRLMSVSLLASTDGEPPRYYDFGTTAKGLYRAFLPTDVQAYYVGDGDFTYMEEYQSLSDGIGEVEKHSYLTGAAAENPPATQAAEQAVESNTPAPASQPEEAATPEQAWTAPEGARTFVQTGPDYARVDLDAPHEDYDGWFEYDFWEDYSDELKAKLEAVTASDGTFAAEAVIQPEAGESWGYFLIRVRNISGYAAGGIVRVNFLDAGGKIIETQGVEIPALAADNEYFFEARCNAEGFDHVEVLARSQAMRGIPAAVESTIEVADGYVTGVTIRNATADQTLYVARGRLIVFEDGEAVEAVSLWMNGDGNYYLPAGASVSCKLAAQYWSGDDFRVFFQPIVYEEGVPYFTDVVPYDLP